MSIMKKSTLYSLFLFGFLLCDTGTASAQLSMTGGNPTLAITTGTPGGPAAVVDVSTTVRYRRQNIITKITVATACPGQDFTLKVVAVSVPAGVAAPEVTLTNGMLSQNLITNIPTSPPGGNVNTGLQYTASSTWGQGNSSEVGDDIHTVTYTLVAQ